MIPGVTTVTFKRFSPREVLSIVSNTDLQAIEWSGNSHVPHGCIGTAKEVAQMSADHGLLTPSYASYYRLAESKPSMFEDSVNCAKILNAKMIRIWAGSRASSDADQAFRKKVTQDAIRINKIAQSQGFKLVLEWHNNTLMDNINSALELLQTVNSDNLGTYWQTKPGFNSQSAVEEIKKIEPWLFGFHVQYRDANNNLCPLENGEKTWQDWGSLINQNSGKYAYLEMFDITNINEFIEDSRTLVRICQSMK